MTPMFCRTLPVSCCLVRDLAAVAAQLGYGSIVRATVDRLDGAGWPLHLVLPVLLLAGGALNGFAVRIAESWTAGGGASLFLGVSPFEIIVLGAALSLIAQNAEQAPRLLGWPEALFLAVLLLPSSAMSWLGLTLYATYLGCFGRARFRAGAVLLALLGVSALWASVGLRWAALPITTLEAHVIGAGLALFRADLTVAGNVVGIPGGHQVILLAACSSAYLVPKAVLAVFAMAQFFQSALTAPLVRLLIVTALLLTAANWLRLGVMVWSDPMFRLAHGPVGANVFDLVQTALILWAGYLLCRR